MHDDSDHALADRAKCGDEAAFSALVGRHWPMIYRVAHRWCGDRADAEDVAQEVCVKLARAIATYRGEAAFTTWVTRLTINAVRDLIRARQRHAGKVAALAVVTPAECDGGVEDAVAANELWRAVHELPDRQRDAVLLVYGEGLSHAEAASVLGCRESTLSWHVHEARKALKRQLGDEPEPQEATSASGATGT